MQFQKQPGVNVHNASDANAPKPVHGPRPRKPGGVHDASNPDQSRATAAALGKAQPAMPAKR